MFYDLQPQDDDDMDRNDDNVMMMDDIPDVPDVEIPNMEQVPDSQNNQSEHVISQDYEGAPEAVRTKLLFGCNQDANLYAIFIPNRLRRSISSLHDERKWLTWNKWNQFAWAQ